MKIIKTLMSKLGYIDFETHKTLLDKQDNKNKELESRVSSLASCNASLKKELRTLELSSKKDSENLQAEAAEERRVNSIYGLFKPRLDELIPHKGTGLFSQTMSWLEPISSCLGKRDNHSLSLLGLHSVIAHAGESAVAKSKLPTIENGISTCLVGGIRDASEILKKLLHSAHIEMGVSTIYDRSNPALKENVCGADILLVVAGDDLLPNGGIRLFWIQAKQNSGKKNPFNMDYSQKKKNTELYQFDDLEKAHNPDKGSFSIYIAYSPYLDFIPAISVASMKVHPPEKQNEWKVDLSESGARLQEFILAYLSTADVGQFNDANEAIKYMDEVFENAIVPMDFVYLHAHKDGRARAMVQELHSYAAQALGNNAGQQKANDDYREWGAGR